MSCDRARVWIFHMLVVLAATTVTIMPCMAQQETPANGQTQPPKAKALEPADKKFVDDFPDKDTIIYLLKDYPFGSKDGKVVISEEEYRALTQSKAETEIKQPWTITELTIQGSLDRGNKSRLAIEMEVRVNDPAGALVDIKMQEGNFEYARKVGGEPAILRRKADGYELHIDKPGDFRYRFELFVESEQTPTENRLQLSLPTSSVKRADLKSNEALLFARNSKSDEKLAIGEDRMTLRPPLRAEDSLAVAWKVGKFDETPVSLGKRVHGVLKYRLVGENIETDAELTMDLGGQSQSCVLKLPLGEQVRSVTAVQNDQTLLTDFEESDEEDHHRVKVNFVVPVNGQTKLQVLSDRTRPDPSEPLNLGMFEVEQAETQTGYALLFTKDELWIRFDPKQGMRRVEVPQLESALQELKPARAFQYSRQPATLQLELRTEPLVTASSDTQVTISPTQARFASRFEFLVRQAEASMLRLRVPAEMRIEEIGPVSLIKQDAAIPVEGDATLKEIPLRFSEPKIGTVDVMLHGNMPLSTDQTNVLAIPCPSSDIVWKGTVTVKTDNGLTLEVDDQKLRNLRREPLPSEQLPDQLAWHFRHDQKSPALAFRLRELPERLEVAIDSEFHWRDDRIQVDSTLRFRSHHHRMEEIVLQVPAELQGVTVTGGTVSTGVPLTRGRQILQLVNPSQDCDVQLHYEFPTAIDEGPVQVQVPLVLPEGDVVTTYKGTVWCEPGMRVGVESPWESGGIPPASPAFEDQPNLVVTSSHPPETIGLRLDPSVALAPLVIPRVVVEEVLAGNGKRSGIKRMLISAHRIRELRLAIPENCTVLSIAVNGIAVDDPPQSPRLWKIRLPSADRPCSLEVAYNATYAGDRQFGALRRVNVDTPYLADDVAIQEVRWVIRAKKDVLVLRNVPDDFGSLRWHWLGFLAKPVTRSNYQETKDWLESADRTVKWSDSTFASIGGSSEWCYETWGNSQSLSMWIVPYTFWVLLCSGFMLVVGLSVSRSAMVTQLQTLLAVAVVAALGMLFVTEWTLWVWYGAQWGIYLSVAAIVLRHLAVRRRRLRYMLGRSIRKQDGVHASLSSLVGRLPPQERAGSARLGTTIDA